MSRQKRSTSRPVWRGENYRDDDEDEEREDSDCMMRRGRVPSRSPDRARARSSGARSSGLQRPHLPDAGTPKAPPRLADRPVTPPRRGRLRGRPP
eukprot:5345609-Pyramimonas_sp.AAC.1